MSTRLADATTAGVQTRAALLDILATHHAHVPDEPGTPIRSRSVEFVPAAHDTALIDEILALITSRNRSAP